MISDPSLARVAYEAALETFPNGTPWPEVPESTRSSWRRVAEAVKTEVLKREVNIAIKPFTASAAFDDQLAAARSILDTHSIKVEALDPTLTTFYDVTSEQGDG